MLFLLVPITVILRQGNSAAQHETQATARVFENAGTEFPPGQDEMQQGVGAGARVLIGIYSPNKKPAEIAGFGVKSLVALPGIEPGF